MLFIEWDTPVSGLCLRSFVVLLDASTEVGVEVNAAETKYMLMSQYEFPCYMMTLLKIGSLTYSLGKPENLRKIKKPVSIF